MKFIWGLIGRVWAVMKRFMKTIFSGYFLKTFLFNGINAAVLAWLAAIAKKIAELGTPVNHQPGIPQPFVAQPVGIPSPQGGTNWSSDYI